MNLTKAQWQKIGGVVITALLMIASIAGWYFPVDAPAPTPNYVVTEEEQATIGAQAAKERVTWLIAKKLTVQAGGANLQGAVDIDSTLNVDGASTLVGAVAVTGASTLTGDVDAQGDLTVDDTFNIDDTDSALVGAQTLTATVTFYEFAPATVLTVTLATGNAEVGDLLILSNTVTTQTQIVDTGATVGGSVINLGLNDTAIFIYSNSKWVMLSTANNS